MSWKIYGDHPDQCLWHYEQEPDKGGSLYEALAELNVEIEKRGLGPGLKIGPVGSSYASIQNNVETQEQIDDKAYNEAGRRLNALSDKDSWSREIFVDIVADVANNMGLNYEGGSKALRESLLQQLGGPPEGTAP